MIRTETLTACAPCGYHPLSLCRLAGLVVRDLRQSGDIGAAKRLDVSGDWVHACTRRWNAAAASIWWSSKPTSLSTWRGSAPPRAQRPRRGGWPIPDSWRIECFCLESPKLFFREGYYHLISAQGGTAGPSTSHMVIQARSRAPLGPWENSPYNPVIRTQSRHEKCWSRGHGTVFELLAQTVEEQGESPEAASGERTMTDKTR